MDKLYQYLYENGITSLELIAISMGIITVVGVGFMCWDFAIFIKTCKTENPIIQQKIFIKKLITTLILTLLTVSLLGLVSILL